jgi:hypothetical protein
MFTIYLGTLPRKEGPCIRMNNYNMSMSEVFKEIKKLTRKTEKEPVLFCCGSEVVLDEPVAIFFETKKEGCSKITFPTTTHESLDELIDACSPASFGLGKEEILDPSYRNAVKLDTDHFATNFQLCSTNIIKSIKSMLAPEAGLINAELYKLNIYGKDGFFKKHVDTPRGEKMFGSLVVCLDNPFIGGEFSVQHKGLTEIYDWGERSSLESPNIKWCAFYSDCEHEVLPVQSGERVTLTYLLSECSNGQSDEIRSNVGNRYYNFLKKALDDPSFFPNGIDLGFLFDHKYTSASSLLKGSDLSLLNAANALSLNSRRMMVADLYQLEGYGEKYKFRIRRKPESGPRDDLHDDLPDDPPDTDTDNESTSTGPSLDSTCKTLSVNTFLKVEEKKSSGTEYIEDTMIMDESGFSGGSFRDYGESKKFFEREYRAQLAKNIIWLNPQKSIWQYVRSHEKFYSSLESSDFLYKTENLFSDEVEQTPMGNSPQYETIYAKKCLIVTIPQRGTRTGH